MFDRERRYYAFETLESERQALLTDTTPLNDPDLGAGSRKPVRRVCDLARASLSSPARCQALFRLVTFHKPERTLEIGTSLGLSTAYLSAAYRTGQVVGLDAAPQRLAIARRIAQSHCLDNISFVEGDFAKTLSGALEQLGTFDLALLDGNHRYQATLDYFNHLCAHANERAIIIVDDIRWSPEMYRAWREIRENEGVTASVDCFRFGMVFFRDAFRGKLDLRVVPGPRFSPATWR